MQLVDAGSVVPLITKDGVDETLREHTWCKDFGDVPVPSRPDHTGDALIPHVTEPVEDVRDIPL